MKFQVGDIVKVSMEEEYEYYSNGAIGTILRIDSADSIQVKFFEGEFKRCIDNCWWIGSDELELVYRAPAIPEDELLEEIEEDEDVPVIEVEEGGVYRIYGDFYVIVVVDYNQYCLINMINFNRWIEPLVEGALKKLLTRGVEDGTMLFMGNILEQKITLDIGTRLELHQ